MEMDIGLGFDDEDLQINSKDKTGDLHVPYNVKICNPKWFQLPNTFESNDNKEILEKGQLEQLQHKMKFDADLHYRQMEYSHAAQRYERLLDILPSSNAAIRLDVKESLSRCYIYLGKYEESLQQAQDIAEEISKDDDSRYRQSLMLLSFVYEKAEKWNECVDHLQNLCELQPFFPQTWHKLGDIYTNILSVKYLSSADIANYLIKQLTCFMRARFLLLSVMGNATQFVKQRNESMIEELKNKIEAVPLSDSEKTFAHEFIEKEIESLSSNFKESQRIAEESKSHPLELFYQKYCSWHACASQDATEMTAPLMRWAILAKPD